ncbi:MAG: FG-GAP repeat protein, partial [Planctomycetota bacterium]
ADIVVATTTAGQSAPGKKPPLATDMNTARVTVFTEASNFTKNRSFLINSFVPQGPPVPKGKPKDVNIFFNGASLAAGDVDNDLKADLVLGAQSSGQGNFRVLPNAAVASGLQSDVNRALSSKFTQPPNPPTGGAWQPTGGPAYHLTAVPMPTGLGFNAPLAVAVIEADGRDFRADVFAAFGGANQTPNNQVRRLQWDGSKWTAANHLQVVPQTKASVAVRFASGNGINLG